MRKKTTHRTSRDEISTPNRTSPKFLMRSQDTRINDIRPGILASRRIEDVVVVRLQFMRDTAESIFRVGLLKEGRGSGTRVDCGVVGGGSDGYVGVLLDVCDLEGGERC